jgi:DNA-binding NarL/FixJ family response regulator
MAIRVLIVDDHAAFRATARSLLEAEGLEVVGEAPDGASGIAAVRRIRPEVVLLDVQLPDMDGFAVAAELAGNGPRPTIVLTSSRSAEELAGMLATTAADGFIPKAELSGAALEAFLR